MKTIWMINLNHPCYEADIWRCENDEEVRQARGQGYMELEDVREIVAVELAFRRVEAEIER